MLLVTGSEDLQLKAFFAEDSVISRDPNSFLPQTLIAFTNMFYYVLMRYSTTAIF